MNYQEGKFSKYIDEFCNLETGEQRAAFIHKIADETGEDFRYVKKYLYNRRRKLKGYILPGGLEQPQPEQKKELSTSELIYQDRVIQREKATARIAEQKYKHLLKQYDELEQRFDFLISVKEPDEIPVIEKPTEKDSLNHATPIILLSDWHFEETVDPETINNLNEYNLEIAQKRWSRCIQNSLRLVQIDRNHSQIDNLVIWLGGDFMTGYIHEEMMQVNSLSPTQATRWAKKNIIAGLEFYLQHGKFKKIIVVCNYGNHGRVTQKKQIAVSYKNSYEWMMYNDIQDYFIEKGETRIEFKIPNGLFAYVSIYDFVCRFWHGDTISYQGGIGGLTVPLIKAIHRYNQQVQANYNFMGHYHQHFQATRDCIVNGSGIGFNAYAQSIGASPEAPVQGYCLLDSKKGMTIKAPIFC